MSGIAQDTRLEMLRDDVKRHGPEAVALFEQILAQGETPEWAAMCACRQAPGTRNTDRAFCQGAQRRMNSMGSYLQEQIVKRAQKAGINTQGKYYKAGLGRYEDPAAWVSCADDVLAVAKARNLNVEGVINHKAVEREIKPKRVPLAEDIIQAKAKEILKAEPDTAAKVKRSAKAKRELRERIIATYSRKRNVG